MSDSNIGTARTYAFVGFIFYIMSIIVGLIGILAITFFFVTSVSTSMQGSSPWQGSTASTIIAFPVFGIVMFIFFLLFIAGIILTIFAWITVRDIDRGTYDRARTNSLILGIIGLFFGLVVGGIFFLLAYSKLGESTTQPLPRRFCVNCGKAVSSDAKFCSNCGKEFSP
jgi:hypothetical protein